jgi:SWI/SNF-related matrix-associated actin-dependent regulator 1 of chromatin subfamily A
MRVNFTLLGGRAFIAPVGYVGSKWVAYKAACDDAGAQFFAGPPKGQKASLGAVPALVRALTTVGFEPMCSPELDAVVKADTAAAMSDSHAAEARSAAVDEALRAKGLALYPFQKSGVAWLAPRKAGLLADEMGLGKTVQAILALPDGAPVLVVAPAVAKGVWRREFAKWRPEFTVRMLSGRGSFAWPVQGEVVIVNYDILPATLSQDLLPGTVVIADEAHALKNSKAQRTRKFRAISEAVRKAGGRVWLLTATPMLNRAPELWTVLNAAGLAGEAFGNWPKFCALFGGREGRYGMEWSGRVGPEAGDLLRRVSLRRLRTDVLPDLPTKVYKDIPMNNLSASCKKLCDEVLAKMEKAQATLENFHSVAFEEMSRARAALATAKIPSLVDLIEDFEAQDEPVVVFSAHRAPIDILREREGWAVIMGGTPNDERTKIEEAFQRGELKGVGATIEAGGVAITLTRAHHAVFVDQEWTPALNAQAEDRICRIGQTRGVVISRLVAEHELDRRVADLLDTKQALINASVEESVVTDIAAPVFEAIDLPVGDTSVVAKSVAAVAGSKDIVAGDKKPRRAAVSPQEEWAERALLVLTAHDSDHALEENGVGFNRMDTGFGHALAAQISSGLTDKQWESAIRMCRKYCGQVGQCPKDEVQSE